MGIPRSRATMALLALVLALALDDRVTPPARASDPMPARTSGPLAQATYVWQRAWTPPVTHAITEHGASFERVLVLAAELELRGQPRAVAIAWQPEQLAALTHAERSSEIGLVVRVGPWSGPFAELDQPDAVRELLIDTALAQLERTRRAGLEPVELQIDFDAASHDLAGYRRWLVALRVAIREAGFGLPITITALPDWLDREPFLELLDACDGWVLQVHGLVAPRPGQARALFDTEQARRWVERAAALGQPFGPDGPTKPFWVALPSYHYLVAREPGHGGSLAAEQAPAHARIDRFDRVGPDPVALAELISAWTEDRPAALLGLVWFRLPVEGDRFAWSWPALHALMQGRAPTSSLRLHACEREPGLIDLSLENSGELDRWISELEPLQLRWSSGELLVADALAAFRVEPSGDELELHATTHGRIAPGERLALAWLRFDAGFEPTGLTLGDPTIPIVLDCTTAGSSNEHPNEHP